jgi:sigma-70-like protein/HB1/ASXL restriction endonuclease-like protein with HTH domain
MIKNNTEKLLDQILSILNSRQKDVIERRFGLRDGKPITLAELGDNYSITRERVRQIEAEALKELRKFIKGGILDKLLTTVSKHVKNMGGARRETLLLADLQLLLGEKASPMFNNQIKFLLELDGSTKYHTEDEKYFSYWYQEDTKQKKVIDFITKLIKYMKTKKEKILSHDSIDKVFKEAIKPHNLKDLIALNYISISKNFHINNFGGFGLSNWSEVNPRTVCDWAYMVLKKEKKSLHFTEIANTIGVYKNVKKKINPQTVHNELIKDGKFVLVGRGMYSLKEFGHVPGTAKEVMARILKSQGPLKPSELIKFVLKERVFKKNTIFINLQSKKHFTRLDDGKYKANLA